MGQLPNSITSTLPPLQLQRLGRLIAHYSTAQLWLLYVGRARYLSPLAYSGAACHSMLKLWCLGSRLRTPPTMISPSNSTYSSYFTLREDAMKRKKGRSSHHVSSPFAALLHLYDVSLFPVRNLLSFYAAHHRHTLCTAHNPNPTTQ